MGFVSCTQPCTSEVSREGEAFSTDDGSSEIVPEDHVLFRKKDKLYKPALGRPHSRPLLPAVHRCTDPPTRCRTGETGPCSTPAPSPGKSVGNHRKPVNVRHRNAALLLELLQQLRNHSLVSARVYTKSCDILVTDNVTVLNGDLQMVTYKCA